MPDENQKIHVADDFSGATQTTTSRFLRRENELEGSLNARFKNIGGVGIREGYAQTDSDLTSQPQLQLQLQQQPLQHQLLPQHQQVQAQQRLRNLWQKYQDF